MNKNNSSGSEYAGTWGSASHIYQVFYCLLQGNASAVDVLPGRYIQYMVRICKKGLVFTPHFFFSLSLKRLLQSQKRYMISAQHAGLMASVLCLAPNRIQISFHREKNLTPRNGCKLTNTFSNLLQLVALPSHYIAWLIFSVGSIPGPFKKLWNFHVFFSF